MSDDTKSIIFFVVLLLTMPIWVVPVAIYSWLFAPKWYQKEPWNWQ